VVMVIRQFARVRVAASSLLTPPSDAPVSVLTSERRDVWAKVRACTSVCALPESPTVGFVQARDQLRALDPMNAESLKTIESALFLVAFEPGHSNELEVLAQACLHGGTGRNKWFDKPFNLIVFENGRVGVNGEVCVCGPCDVSCYASSQRWCGTVSPTPHRLL
jgi:hypothetical protein